AFYPYTLVFRQHRRQGQPRNHTAVYRRSDGQIGALAWLSASARRFSSGSNRLLNRSGIWSTSCGTAVCSTTSRWSSASPGGASGTAARSAASSRKPNARPCVPPSPQYADIHSEVVQDVLACPDRTHQALLRRRATGEKPGFPCFQRRWRYHSFTFKEQGNGAQLDNDFL